MKKAVSIFTVIILSFSIMFCDFITAFSQTQGEIVVCDSEGNRDFHFLDNDTDKSGNLLYTYTIGFDGTFTYGADKEISIKVLRRAIEVAGLASLSNDGEIFTVKVPEGKVYVDPTKQGAGNAIKVYSGTVIESNGT